ncbi:MAG: hypothetical protein KJP00_06530 [Bacteroidia bacterium]|nr:hypothetical protein [Bacteroidia bacterium]
MGNVLLCEAQIMLDEDPAITDLMNRFVVQNKERTQIKGYRIQIYSTTDRVKIQQQAGAFAYRFPDMKANWINEKPYYKLRAGAFATKLDCAYVLHKVQEYFRGAYIVVDNNISISEILDQQSD